MDASSVKAFMSGDPVSVEPETSALEAFERMLERGIRHLPVLDPQRRVVGVLSIDDLRAALPFPLSLRRPLEPPQRDAAREWQVGDIMSYAPETLGPEASLADAAERMAERRIGCLPVVDEEGRLTGLLSETDVLWALATSLDLRRRERKAGAERDRPDELVALTGELRLERERLRARVEQRVVGEQELERTMREEPLDEAERGADLTEVGAARALDELALRRLAALDHALDRAEQGVLGTCERCGGAIPVPRLRALPGATQCIACARAER
jgi:acetoin utilization protein AcuB